MSVYDIKPEIYTLHNYNHNEDNNSSIYIFSPSAGELGISVDNLAIFLPTSKPAVDLTMTMAG